MASDRSHAILNEQDFLFLSQQYLIDRSLIESTYHKICADPKSEIRTSGRFLIPVCPLGELTCRLEAPSLDDFVNPLPVDYDRGWRSTCDDLTNAFDFPELSDRAKDEHKRLCTERALTLLSGLSFDAKRRSELWYWSGRRSCFDCDRNLYLQGFDVSDSVAILRKSGGPDRVKALTEEFRTERHIESLHRVPGLQRQYFQLF
jgi:hypothetical protein